MLASVNHVDPDKYQLGLGGRRMAVTAPEEDPVTMAVEAADSAFQRFEVDPESIGLLVVGTESGVDGAKPIASYVHGLLGLPTDCRAFDAKHACYSGTAALRTALNWCTARPTRDHRKALVIATDIARYDLGSAGEPTQGAGAVAVIVSDQPSVLVLDPFPESVFTEQVMDFWRPHYRSDALVNGALSIERYLKALERTYSAYRLATSLGFCEYDYFLFHVPFPKMAYKAFRLLHELEAGSIGRAGPRRPLEIDFELRVRPALWANMEIGNIYSGSLYLSLASLLEQGGGEVTGARLGLYSYGSGCCSEFFSGRIGDDPERWRGRIGIHQGLQRRLELDYAQYLDFRNASEAMARDGSCGELPLASPGWRVSFCGIHQHQRVYRLAERDRRHASPDPPALGPTDPIATGRSRGPLRIPPGPRSGSIGGSSRS
jgi:hydroxymethylglutaryl-CoA synthase